ncbi:hypothetical protein GCM10011494_19490 [Novosphingobium endophyticum]|uniref:Uncharacterized protein n=1 Tax=Novosphingobium endophyticum TaxID=1955250 RepID=A0A916TTG3_9SPHN|nr:hypothetical protein [Novosphingobium endophyticum]GGC01009.1 hypothetical protein GCM10011494_19490 [Novosphingobium endophyticum]
MSTNQFIIFDATEGGQVAVNVAKVALVRPRVDGNGMFISFLGDDGVGVPGTLKEVVEKLTAKSNCDEG